MQINAQKSLRNPFFFSAATFLSILIVASFASPFTSVTAFAKEVTVNMKSIRFDPKTIEIAVGDSVIWKNTSYTEHSATAESFDTGQIEPKKSSKPIVFTQPGVYDYHCKIHGKSMSGHVNVSASAKAPPNAKGDEK